MSLPHWEQIPADLPEAIRQVKDALRARIAASGRTVEEVFAVVERRLTAEADEIAAARDRGEAVYERTWADRFSSEDLNETGRRGLGLDG
jgi:hypothetical protein